MLTNKLDKTVYAIRDSVTGLWFNWVHRNAWTTPRAAKRAFMAASPGFVFRQETMEWYKRVAKLSPDSPRIRFCDQDRFKLVEVHLGLGPAGTGSKYDVLP